MKKTLCFEKSGGEISVEITLKNISPQDTNDIFVYASQALIEYMIKELGVEQKAKEMLVEEEKKDMAALAQRMMRWSYY